jgi:c(7)-type cytochrome triheme protein
MANDTKMIAKRQSVRAQRRSGLIVLVAGCLAFGYVFSSCSRPETTGELTPIGPQPANTSEISAVPVIDPGMDFSQFQHTDPAHARFPCALCHERKDNSATPKFSGHLPCSGCHVAQFADNKSAICTICHTDAAAGTLKRFPALKSFNAVFNHARHLGQASCIACHKPLQKGAALSIPSGLNAHNACFQCHSPGAKSGERNIDSCGTCHQQGKPGGKISEWVKAFERTPFSHAAHRQDCTTCHSVKAIATRGGQVGAPLAAMHNAPKTVQSCASCHNNKRVFGGDDFSDCTRCHKGPSYKLSQGL